MVSDKLILERLSVSLGDSLIEKIYVEGNPWILKIKFELRAMNVIVYHRFCHPDTHHSNENYRISLVTTGQKPNEHRYIDSDLDFVILLGYVQEYDVFVLWDAFKNPEFSFNKSFQVKISTIIQAKCIGTYNQSRKLRNGGEVEEIICCSAEKLAYALSCRFNKYRDDLLNGNLERFLSTNNKDLNKIRRDQIVEFVKNNPGSSIEQISSSLQIDKKEIEYHAHVLHLNGLIDSPEMPKDGDREPKCDSTCQKTLKDFEFDNSYFKDAGSTRISDGFYIPCMKNAIRYDRITGFFSSSVYCVIWEGLREFVSNKGQIRLLCSPRLYQPDREAVCDGLENRDDEKISESLKAELHDMLDDKDLEIPSKILCCLISSKIMDIRLVTTKPNDMDGMSRGMFHDKIGIFTDRNEDYVAFCGSMNETENGLSELGNSETITVHLSWDIGRDGERARDLKERFNKIWEKQVPGICVHDLPDDIRKELEAQSKDIDVNDLFEELELSKSVSSSKENRYSFGNYTLRPHQIEAIIAWKANGRRGILKHATGSGKTVTGMYCIMDSLSRGEIPIIVVPSQDLLLQWESAIKNEQSFKGLTVYSCGGKSSSPWKSGLHRWTRPNGGKKVIIAVINTASADNFRGLINAGQHLFILCDEVHRSGSKLFRRLFEIESGPRLGLSATPMRFMDPEGNKAISDYFGPVVHTFTLNDAIKAGILTEYFYYPREVHLQPQEIQAWNNLTRKINKLSYKKDDPEISDKIHHLQIQRARIGKKAVNKTQTAIEIVSKHFVSGEKWIVYCDDKQQLDEIWKGLTKAKITSHKYYADEHLNREATLESFNEGGGVLVSIRCLDEGVDIPAVTHALIVASSKNPREFIQRRGRVLRKCEGKTYSYVYDLIVVPGLDGTLEMENNSMVVSELNRSINFAHFAKNCDVCTKYLESIAFQCNVDFNNIIEENLEDD